MAPALVKSVCGGQNLYQERVKIMSIEKKSLISTLKTTKKANIAKEDFGMSGASVSPAVKQAVVRNAATKQAVVRNATARQAITKQATMRQATTRQAVAKQAITKQATTRQAVAKQASKK